MITQGYLTIEGKVMVLRRILDDVNNPEVLHVVVDGILPVKCVMDELALLIKKDQQQRIVKILEGYGEFLTPDDMKSLVQDIGKYRALKTLNGLMKYSEEAGIFIKELRKQIFMQYDLQGILVVQKPCAGNVLMRYLKGACVKVMGELPGQPQVWIEGLQVMLEEAQFFQGESYVNFISSAPIVYTILNNCVLLEIAISNILTLYKCPQRKDELSKLLQAGKEGQYVITKELILACIEGNLHQPEDGISESMESIPSEVYVHKGVVCQDNVCFPQQTTAGLRNRRNVLVDTNFI